jgi:hypothetical protein
MAWERAEGHPKMEALSFDCIGLVPCFAPMGLVTFFLSQSHSHASFLCFPFPDLREVSLGVSKTVENVFTVRSCFFSDADVDGYRSARSITQGTRNPNGRDAGPNSEMALCIYFHFLFRNYFSSLQ